VGEVGERERGAGARGTAGGKETGGGAGNSGRAGRRARGGGSGRGWGRVRVPVKTAKKARNTVSVMLNRRRRESRLDSREKACGAWGRAQTAGNG